jgi:hypothetical protein
VQILYKYERNWNKAAQSNWLWTFMKLAYTQISLQYFGASLLTQQHSSLRDASHVAAFLEWHTTRTFLH